MLLHTGLVMRLDKIRYGLIQFHQGVEDALAQLGIYTLIDTVHIALHWCLILRLPNPGRKGYEAIVVAHIREDPVQLWRPSIRLYDGRLEVVGNNHMGNPTKCLNTHPERIGEVFDLLRRNGYGKGKAAERHRPHEHFHVDFFAGLRINVRELVAGEVNHEYLVEELALPVPVRILPAVLLPQEQTGYMLVLKLLAEVRQLFQEDLHALVGVRRITGEHVSFKFWFIQVEKGFQTQRIRLDFTYILIDRALVKFDNFRYRPVGHAVAMHQ